MGRVSLRSRPPKYLPTVYINLFSLEFLGSMVVLVYQKKKKEKVIKQGGRWTNARKFSFEILYGGHFAVSTRLITLTYLIFTLIFDTVFYFPLHIFFVFSRLNNYLKRKKLNSSSSSKNPEKILSSRFSSLAVSYLIQKRIR